MLRLLFTLQHIRYLFVCFILLRLSSDGYVKMVDFGNACKFHGKCYTLCGTADYVSPEVWLSKGYSFGVDHWALGVLMYEMLVGSSPFELTDKGHTDQCFRIINGVVSTVHDRVY